MSVGIWAVFLVAMAVVLFLQNFTEYTASQRVRDYLSNAGFFIILAFILIDALYVFWLRRSRFFPFNRGVTWVLAALLCWWLFFRDSSGDGV